MTEIPVLGLLLLLVVVSAPWWVKRLRAGGPQSNVSVLGRTALSRNTVVAVVRVGDRQLLVGAGEHGVNVLTELDPADRTDADPATEAVDAPSTAVTHAGPRIGPLDRLRAMTVRTTPIGRPIRVPSRR